MPKLDKKLDSPTADLHARSRANVFAWILGILVMIYLVGVISGYISKDNRLGANEFLLLLLLVLGAIGFFGKISEINFGEGKFSIKLQEVEKRQESTEKMVDAVRTALEGIVTKYERQHLEKLLPQNNDIVRFGPHFFSEIERLDAIGFIAPVKEAGLVAIEYEHGKPGEELHLREYAKLTEQGMKYLNVVGSIN